MKKILMIIAPENFQDYEYSVPKDAFAKAGYEVTTASKAKGECQGKFGSRVNAEVALSKVNVEVYDAVVFVGGPGAPVYQKDKEAHRVAREIQEKGKVLAAICIAPTILAYAGVLNGKKATVWNGDGEQEHVLTQNGAQFVDEDVVEDGLLVTANGPDAAGHFAQAILTKLR